MRTARMVRRITIIMTTSAALLVSVALPAADAGSADDSPIPQLGGGSSAQPGTKTESTERDDAKLLRLHNTDRSRRGLHTLTTDASLTSFARRRAVEMAQSESVWHSRNLPAGKRWYIVGENVGRATTIEEVWEGFLTSASHRANVFRAGFRGVGIGVATRAGARYVAVVYGQPWPPPPAVTAPAASAPRSAVAAAPAAAQKPAPPRTSQTETQTVSVLVRLHALEQ